MDYAPDVPAPRAYVPVASVPPGAEAETAGSLLVVDPRKERARFLRLWEPVKLRCKRWHEGIRQARADFRMENTGDNDPDTPDGERIRLSDLGRGALQAAAILRMADHQLQVYRHGEDDLDKTKADHVEKYLRAVVQMAEQRRGTNLAGDNTLGVFKDTCSVVHWWYDDTLPGLDPWLELEDPDEAPLAVPPIDIDVVNPLEFYPMLAEGWPMGQFRYIIHRTKRTAQEVLDEWGFDAYAAPLLEEYAKHLTPDQKLSDRREFLDYWGWSRDERGQYYVENAILFDNKVVLRPFVRMEEYKVLPWVLIPYLEDRSETDYEKRWLGFGHWGRPQVRRKEKLLGRYDAIVDDIANTPPRGYYEVGAQPEFVYGAKQIFWLNRARGQDFIPPSQQYGQAPVDLRYLLQEADVQQQKAILPDAIYGMGHGGTGYAFDQQQEGGRLPLVAPRDNLSVGWAAIYKGIGSLIAEMAPLNPIYAIYRRRIGRGLQMERVSLHGYDLGMCGAGDNTGWFVDVQWSAELPGDSLRKSAQATQLSGILPLETIIEDVLGYPDPQVQIRRKFAEMVKLHDPQLNQLVAHEAYREQGGRPTLQQVELLKITRFLEQKEAEMMAVGMPPEMIQMRLAAIMEGIRMSIMGDGVPVEDALGGPRPVEPGGAVGKTGPDQPRDPANPNRDNATGLPPQLAAGAPPPGSPNTAGAVLTGLARETEARPPMP